VGQDWVEFRRPEPAVVVDMVRAVAARADPGQHGQGVEVVIEAPKPRLLADIFGAEPASARIAVTKAGGELSYPFHIQLFSDQGGDAGRRLPVRTGWAVSNSAGLAFLMQKGRPGDPFDWPALVEGALSALCVLRPDAGDEGWRAALASRSQDHGG
jgi:hypothetical protein